MSQWKYGWIMLSMLVSANAFAETADRTSLSFDTNAVTRKVAVGATATGEMGTANPIAGCSSASKKFKDTRGTDGKGKATAVGAG